MENVYLMGSYSSHSQDDFLWRPLGALRDGHLVQPVYGLVPTIGLGHIATYVACNPTLEDASMARAYTRRTTDYSASFYVDGEAQEPDERELKLHRAETENAQLRQELKRANSKLHCALRILAPSSADALIKAGGGKKV